MIESKLTDPEIRKQITELNAINRDRTLASNIRDAALTLVCFYGAVLDARMAAAAGEKVQR